MKSFLFSSITSQLGEKTALTLRTALMATAGLSLTACGGSSSSGGDSSEPETVPNLAVAQFYQVQNPESGNQQIVRYDPNDSNPDTNQVAIKQNVILGNKTFVMSGQIQGDAIEYTRREYAVFLDPTGSSDVRTTGGDEPTEYIFYTDNRLKRFDAEAPDNENTIFDSSQLPDNIKSQGVNVIGADFELFLNETDIDNSYVQLQAFDQVPDLMKGETADDKTHLPLTVRIADSKVTAGRIIQPIINTNGQTTQILINNMTASLGSLPQNAKLQLCQADLTDCTDVNNGAGDFHYLTQNDQYLYLAREGVKTLFAFDKNTGQVAPVSGATYPAAYNAEHHQISFAGGHGGAGIFSNFNNLANVRDHLSEGDNGYLLVNYNLDTQNPMGEGMFGDVYAPKNAMILKFNGTSAVKVYDNGNGVDLMNESDNVPTSYNLTLTAVKNGQIFVEASKNTPEKTFSYQQGWINSLTETGKAVLDNIITDQTVNYFTSIRVPAVAVGDTLYVNETSPQASQERVYNIYKRPITDSTTPKPDAPDATGRMYFERTAYRKNGVYDGNVLLWDKYTGDVLNATTNVLMGNSVQDVNENVSNVMADPSGNTTLAGVGGLFGLYMTTAHDETPFLTSGFSAQEGSLKKVNQIDGQWIID